MHTSTCLHCHRTLGLQEYREYCYTLHDGGGGGGGGKGRGGSRISEKGGLLITIHEAGEGSGAEPQPPTLLFHVQNVMILPCRLFARRAAVVLRILATFTSQ